MTGQCLQRAGFRGLGQSQFREYELEPFFGGFCDGGFDQWNVGNGGLPCREDLLGLEMGDERVEARVLGDEEGGGVGCR